MKITKPIRKRTFFVTFAGLLILLVAGGSTYRYIRSKNQPSQIKQNINFGPPTETEKRETEAHKNEIVKNNQNIKPSSTYIVTPIITSAQQLNQQVTINAYVPNVIEEGGTCTVTFSKQADVITKEVTAFADASVTNCKPLRLDRVEFMRAGTWTVAVTYRSSNVTGSSQPRGLEIQ